MSDNVNKPEITVSPDEQKIEVFKEKRQDLVCMAQVNEELVYAHQVKDPSFDMSLSHLLDVLLWVRTLQ